MILTGTNYNISNPADEIRRLRGGSVYNESRAEHFSALHSRSTGAGLFSSNADPDRFSELEYVERVNATEPRKRVYNTTLENSGRSISGRSTAGIQAQRLKEPAIDARIVLANTARQMGLTQQLLP